MLYICPTPIGNLEDITLRVLKILKDVDYIACEDTRHTIKLLNHFDIKNKLISIHEHNEFNKKAKIIDDLKAGMSIALVSDAGTPGIQDPGKLIILDCIEFGLEFTVLPGACALITAGIGSGLIDNSFTFLGFLPRKSKDRKEILERYSKLPSELILYESPHRITDLIEDIRDVLGNRNISLAKEISKKYETQYRMTADDLLKFLKEDKIKGELVVIIQGNHGEVEENFSDEKIIQLLEEKIEQGFTKKDAIKGISKEYSISKNRIYELSIKI